MAIDPSTPPLLSLIDYAVRDELRWHVERLERMLRRHREWFNDEAWFQHIEAAQRATRAALQAVPPTRV